jgi:hypothetical protein
MKKKGRGETWRGWRKIEVRTRKEGRREKRERDKP